MLLEPNYTAFILKFKTIHYHRKSRLKVYTATEIAFNVFSDYSSKANWITIAICNGHFIGTPINQNHVDNMMPNTWKQTSVKEN